MELSIIDYYTYRVTKININPKKKGKIKIPYNGIPITQEEIIKVEERVTSGILNRKH